MNVIDEHQMQCPYCGELISMVVDCSVEQQSYIEDCEVCCQPIVVSVLAGDSETSPQISVEQENA